MTRKWQKVIWPACLIYAEITKGRRRLNVWRDSLTAGGSMVCHVTTLHSDIDCVGSEWVKFGCYAVHRALLCKLWRADTQREEVHYRMLSSGLWLAAKPTLLHVHTHTLSWGHTDFSSSTAASSSSRLSSHSLSLLRQLFSCGPGMTGAGRRNREHRAFVSVCIKDGMWSGGCVMCSPMYLLRCKSSSKNWNSVVSVSMRVSLSVIVLFHLFCFFSGLYHTVSPDLQTNTYFVYGLPPPSRVICVSDVLCVTCMRTFEQSGNQTSQLMFQCEQHTNMCLFSYIELFVRLMEHESIRYLNTTGLQ